MEKNKELVITGVSEDNTTENIKVGSLIQIKEYIPNPSKDLDDIDDMEVSDDIDMDGGDSEVGETIETIEDPKEVIRKELEMKFDINTRFDFLKKLTKMVSKNKTESLIVTGKGGLGKTFVVTKAVKKYAKDGYKVVKGYTTPRGLYNTLFDYNGKLIIFDDCDSVFEKSTSLNILKGALDSYDRRIITWAAQMRKGDEYPQEFEFTGRIIFISNRERKRLDQAIISRSLVVDLSMSQSEKIERMRKVLKKVSPKIPLSVKQESLDLIEKYQDDIVDLNFRTLIKVSKIRNAFPKDWEELAKYAMFEG